MKEKGNYHKLLKIFKNQGYITRDNVKSIGVNTWFLSDFVKRNHLIKIAPGFYADDNYIVDDYFILQRRYPKYIFSGMSALYLHHLTDKIPTELFVTSPQGYNPTRRKNDKLVINKISNIKIYNLGIEEVETMFGNKVRVYDKEKTICNLIKNRREYDSETFVKAIRIYAKSNVNQSKLFEYARIMKIEKKVYEIMEVVMNED